MNTRRAIGSMRSSVDRPDMMRQIGGRRQTIIPPAISPAATSWPSDTTELWVADITFLPTLPDFSTLRYTAVAFGAR